MLVIPMRKGSAFFVSIGEIRGSRVVVNDCLMNISVTNYNSPRMQCCLETTSNKKMEKRYQ